MVRIQQLTYFVAICDTGSFTAAATQLFVAQPSLSQQIRLLERELGGELLQRTAHGVVPTPAGQVFLAASRRILADIDRTVGDVRDVLSGRSGETVLVSVRSIIAGILPPAIRQLHDVLPGIVCRLNDHNHRRKVEAAVLLGDGDLGVGPRPPTWSGPVVSLGFEEIVLVGRRSDQADPWTTSELNDAMWILYDPDHGFSDVMDQFCAQLGLDPAPVARCDQVEAVLSLAAQGLGVGLVPLSVVPLDMRRCLVGRIDRVLVREVTVYACNPRSPVTDQVIDVLKHATLPLIPVRDLPSDALRLSSAAAPGAQERSPIAP